MNIVVAHLLCFVLATTDVVARAVRYRLLLGGLRQQMRVADALVLTVFGDAMAALTPLRSGGEPARVVAATRSGVSVAPAILALAVENALTYAIALPAGVALAVAYGGDWWRQVGGHSTAIALPLLLGMVALVALVGLVVGTSTWVRVRLARALRHLWILLGDLSRMPIRTAAASIGLSVVSLVARVAIFPVIALATPAPPPLGVAVLASFGLLYGQLAVPTPSGAGPVDVAVLKGAAGVTAGAGFVLATWRLYTTILVAAVGTVLGVVIYGRGMLSFFRLRQPL